MSSAVARLSSAVLAVSFASGSAVRCQTNPPTYRKSVDQKRLALLSIPFSTTVDAQGMDFSDKKGKAYQTLFEAVTIPELVQLTKDPDLSLSLQARWEMARKPMRRKPKAPGYSDWIYDPVSLGDFVSFFTKRVGYAPPNWWGNGIRQVDVFPGRHSASFKIEADELSANSKSGQRGITRKDSGDSTTLSDGTHQIVVRHRYGGMGYFVVFSKDRAYVENYDPVVSYPSTLTCYALPSGAAIWAQEVWGNRRGGFGGFSIHTLSMVLHEDQIAVFGAEFGNYAEAFSVTNGTPIYKFCPTCWFNFPEAWHVPWNMTVAHDK